jgi:FkbM family methyltransferase
MDARCVRNNSPEFALYVTPELSVLPPPQSLTAYLNWQNHGLEVNESSREALDFLRLSAGRTRLLDIGAQTGFMSALFARSRHGAARLVSVEPDRAVLNILALAAKLNGGPTIEWSVAPCALSNITGEISLETSNRLWEREVSDQREIIRVDCLTLEDLMNKYDFEPDIIKIDVESMEYEILLSSLHVLEKLRPAIQLEVHWDFLVKRDRNASDFLRPISDLGYRGIRGRYRSYSQWMALGRQEPVTRLSLAIP